MTALMKDRVCVITGATSGIGREAARGIAAMGARTFLVARNRERGDRVREEIAADTGNRAVEVALCDLASQSEIRRLAEELLDRCPRLHVLVNNAGTAIARRRLTEDGRETTFAVNHLAPFLLTNLLLDRLRESAPARVVTVASDAHRGAVIPFDDLDGETSYAGWDAYGWSKLANILFTTELARRLEGTGVTANCLHPGVVATGLGREAPLLVRAFFAVSRPFLLSPERGAETIVFLASSPKVEGASGGYFERCRTAEPSRAGRDHVAARRLWRVSEVLTGIA